MIRRVIKIATICIVGSGFIGTVIGKGLIKLGHKVFFSDIINKELPNFTKNIPHVIEHSDISLVCVPTPTVNGEMDMSALERAVKDIGKGLVSRQKYHVVTIKSTVLPGTTRNVIIPLLEEYSGKNVGDFGVCMNPEFITEIQSTWTTEDCYKRDFFTEDRIVIGEFNKRSGSTLEEFYHPLNRPIYRVGLETAEMVKYASNCMLATKISFWNEIFLICNALNINSKEVADIVSLDSRIGKYGSVHGKAFGGKCLPKDLRAFISFSEKFYDPRLLKIVNEINDYMRMHYGVRG